MNSYYLPEFAIVSKGDGFAFMGIGKYRSFNCLTALGFLFGPIRAAPDLSYEAKIMTWPGIETKLHVSTIGHSVLVGPAGERILFHADGITYRVSMLSPGDPTVIRGSGWKDNY